MCLQHGTYIDWINSNFYIPKYIGNGGWSFVEFEYVMHFCSYIENFH